MDWSEHLAAVRAETAYFAEVLRAADLDRPVAACGEWTMGDLARHLGAVHRWAASAVRDGRPTDPPEGPTGKLELHRWYLDGAAGLVEALDAAGSDRPCWTLAPPRTAAFWARRQAQETLVHRWDALRSQGRSDLLDPRLCEDGIDEVVTMFYPRQVRLGRIGPLTEAVAFGGWQLGEGAPAAAVVAAPEQLLLLLWGRLPVDAPGVAVLGDGEVVARMLATAIVP